MSSSLMEPAETISVPVKTLQGLGMLSVSMVAVGSKVQCVKSSVVQRRA